MCPITSQKPATGRVVFDAPRETPTPTRIVKFADCGYWRRGTEAERYATVEALRGQLTPQRSKTAESPLPDERAYELLQKICSTANPSLRLYKLYMRMQGFAPLMD